MNFLRQKATKFKEIQRALKNKHLFHK